MKTVFKSDELPHLWAHEKIKFGKTPGNTSCEGLAFKSYGTVIARIVKHKGRKAFILDSEGFSISTSNHQAMVRRAIPGDEMIFRVKKGNRGQTLSEFDRPKNLVAYYYDKFRNDLPFAHPLQHKRREKFLCAVSFLKEAIDCAKFWGLASTKMEKERAKLAPQITEAREFLDARKARLLENEKERELEKFKAKAADAIQTISEREALDGLSLEYLSRCLTLLVSRPDLIARVKAEYDRRITLAREQWLNGGAMENCVSNGPVMLRVAGFKFYHREHFTVEADTVIETTLGARIPLADGERAFRFALSRRTKGWRRNGETFQVGSYQLDSIGADGIIAGCHRISWAEIERFALSQGWITKFSAPV